MKYEYYSNWSATDDFSVVDFVSVGKHGSISKRIEIIPTRSHGVYNLALGDMDNSGNFNDYTTSDNGDRDKILATVIKVIEDYTRKYPDRWIYFAGSTPERTRLYRIVVGLHLEDLSKLFEIFAEVADKQAFQPFQKNIQLVAFLIRRKII